MLGGGDARQAFQRFTLKQPPLTYVSARDADRRRSTLQVRVNDLLWQEVPTLFGRAPDERIYVTRGDDDGSDARAVRRRHGPRCRPDRRT